MNYVYPRRAIKLYQLLGNFPRIAHTIQNLSIKELDEQIEEVLGKGFAYASPTLVPDLFVWAQTNGCKLIITSEVERQGLIFGSRFLQTFMDSDDDDTMCMSRGYTEGDDLHKILLQSILMGHSFNFHNNDEDVYHRVKVMLEDNIKISTENLAWGQVPLQLRRPDDEP